MLDQTFKSRLSKLSSKKQDDRVVQEFALTFVSEEAVQDFLAPLDNEYGLCLRHAFTSDMIDWKRIQFEVRVPLLEINFDSLKMDADLMGINVTHKRYHDHEVFRYDLIFHKNHNPEIDGTFAVTYLNRKEPNEDGKNVFLEYDTSIKAAAKQ